MKTKILTLVSIVAVASLNAAIFDFTDPKGVNNIRFDLDAPLEAISGTGNGISGMVEFDINDPSATAGTITLAVESLTVPNSTMREHLHGENWLDVAQFPEITFEARELHNIKVNDNVVSADVKGHLTVKGITKEKIVPVTFTYLPGRLADRSGVEGDLLVMRSSFSIMRDDFNIRPGQNEQTVAPEIKISLAVAGSAPKN